MENNTVFYRIIDELCQEKKIEQEWLSFDWIRQLKKDGKTRNLIRYQFDLNTSNSFRIAGDKYATYAILKKNNIPVIEHKMIFNPETREEYYSEDLIDNAVKLLDNNEKIIVKANQSLKGKDVYLCETKNEIINVINKLFSEGKDSISACPYFDIEYEYRAVYLCGEILYIYKKEKPFVIGDGINTIRKLILDKYGNDSDLELVKRLDLDEIPKLNARIVVSWKHNLCHGAKPVTIDENDLYYEEAKKIAIESGKAININFATIDIALINKKLYVMEINASVCMDKFAINVTNGYNIAKSIYGKAIDKMFDN